MHMQIFIFILLFQMRNIFSSFRLFTTFLLCIKMVLLAKERRSEREIDRAREYKPEIMKDRKCFAYFAINANKHLVGNGEHDFQTQKGSVHFSDPNLDMV